MTEQTNTAQYFEWAGGQLGMGIEPLEARSGAHSSVYELKAGDKSWYLKIADNLEGERDRLLWLSGKAPTPEVVAFNRLQNKDLLLMTAVQGTDLAHLSANMSPDKIIRMLVEALQSFHAIDVGDCPFKAYKEGGVLVHGDACLPNFIFKDDETYSGCIDLGDMGVGDVEVDLSAAVWSLQYNLGPGHGLTFLKAYGMTDATEQDVERLWNMYASSPIFER